MKSDQEYMQEIARAKLHLVTTLNHSYFNNWLIFTKVALSDQIPTAGVCFRKEYRYELLVNRNFWDNLEFPHQVGLIQHEIYHLIFGHTVPGRFDEDRDHMILNIAMDIAINQYIRPENLPPGGWLPSTLGLAEGLSTLEYYDLLMKNHVKKVKIPKQGQGQGKGNGDGNGDESGKGDEPGYAAGGNHFSSEVEETKVQDQLHTETSAKIYKSSSYGKLPAELERLIDEAIKPSKLDWKQMLRQYLSSKQANFKFKRKYNKKAEFDPRRVHKRKKFVKKAFIGIDVSGSIGAAELEMFFNEVGAIHKGEEGLITVAACDTRITEVFEYEGINPVSLKGGGGTDMQPLCDYMDEHDYDVMIVFTDGYFGEVHCSKPSLWITTATEDFKVVGPHHIVKL
jgi:predicted metal-dependent peptidase